MHFSKIYASFSSQSFFTFKNDSFNDIISKLLDEYEEYQQIKDLIEADKEFTNGEGVHFSSLDELDAYLDD